MTEWLGSLTPGERRQWDAFAARTRKTFRMMDQSAMVMTLVPSGEPDVKFCVEPGMAIMLGKPIVAVAASLADVPTRLRRVADEVIICGDPDSPEGREYMITRLRAFKDRHLR